MKKLDRHLYPELDAILWDRAELLVDPKLAFQMYEERWRFVDQSRLKENEHQLIKDLAQEYGCGEMLTA